MAGIKVSRSTLLNQIIESTRNEHYVPEYRANVSDAEALGVAIAKHFEWGIEEILTVAMAAFEDANMHSGNKVLNEWAESKGLKPQGSF